MLLPTSVPLTSLRLLGLMGSIALASGGLASGALPVGVVPEHFRLGLFTVYFGLMLLLAAWWGLRQAAAGDLLGTLALWCAPLVLAPPLFSRDVYSYLAQGAMVDHGLDVYRLGPSALGGSWAAQVPQLWLDTPTPYGPAFLFLASAVVRATGTDPGAGALALRAIALLGVLLLAAFLPRLARQSTVDIGEAVWLGLLNPLVLLHLVAGAHNDALMLGLLVTGLALAPQHPLLASALVTLAALIKAPAALGLPAVALLATPSARAWGSVAVGSAAAWAGVWALTGVGWEWVAALGTPMTSPGYSLTGLLGRLTGAPTAWRVLGWAAVGVVALVAWLAVFRDGRAGLRTGRVVEAMGLTLAAFALFGPAARPWYLLWGLIPLAATTGSARLRRLGAGLSLGLTPAVMPHGYAPGAAELLVAVAGAAVGLGAAGLVLTRVRRAGAPALSGVDTR